MQTQGIIEWRNAVFLEGEKAFAECVWSILDQLMSLAIYVKHKMEIKGCSKMCEQRKRSSKSACRYQQWQEPTELRAAEWKLYRLLYIVFTARFNAQHASVNIYCVKHYTLHKNSEISEHFVQYSGTFMELFMLMLASYWYLKNGWCSHAILM